MFPHSVQSWREKHVLNHCQGKNKRLSNLHFLQIIQKKLNTFFKGIVSVIMKPVEPNDRAIESLELEGTSEGHLVQLPCNEQGHHS